MGILDVWNDFEPIQDTVEGFSAKFWAKHHRPPVVAVDSYQWLFHIQGGKYKTATLAGFSIQWLLRLFVFVKCGYSIVMVFDGLERPNFKRGEYRVYEETTYVLNAKEICTRLGIPTVTARGEAEAECCMLQAEGKVDYVFSSDADCMLFGATDVIYYETANKWSSDVKSGAGGDRLLRVIHRDDKVNPRHQYLLQVLLIGGDYDTEHGVQGIGSKTAKQISDLKTGFASRLIEIYSDIWTDAPSRQKTEISPSDPRFQYNGNKQHELEQLSRDIEYELKTNERQFLQRKRPSVRIPQNFPDFEIMHKYCFPLVLDQSFTPPYQCVKPDFTAIFEYFQALIVDPADLEKEMKRISSNLFCVAALSHIYHKTDRFEWYKNIRLKKRKHTKSYEEFVVTFHKEFVYDIIDSNYFYFILDTDSLITSFVPECILMAPLIKQSKHFQRIFSVSTDGILKKQSTKSQTKPISKPKMITTKLNFTTNPKRNSHLEDFFIVENQPSFTSPRRNIQFNPKSQKSTDTKDYDGLKWNGAFFYE